MKSEEIIIHEQRHRHRKLDVSTAHKRSMRNRQEILSSNLCGCFKCLRTFPPEQIDEWWDDELTAVCPHCGIDSVLGAASMYPITLAGLKTLRTFAFNGRLDDD